MHARGSLIAVLGLVGTLLGCGDDGTTSITTNPTTTASAATTTISTAQLDSMLLDVNDVGAGWQVGPAVNDADFSDSTQLPCSDMAINPTIIQRLTPVTGIQFEPTDHSYKHMIELVVTGEPEQLDSDLQVYFDAVDACAATTPTTTGTGTLIVEQSAIPAVGDQRAAYILTGIESPDATWYVRDAEVRVGAIAIELALTEILPTPQDEPTISDAEFVQLLQMAVAKLGAP
jgi:hypothetical protein